MGVPALLFAAGLLCCLAGAIAALANWRRPAAARVTAFTFAALGCACQAAASCLILAGATPFNWNLPLSTPIFACAVRLDPLSAWFNLALAVLSFAVTVYSFGYLRPMERTRNLGAMGFFYNFLLLSLTLVFAASNAFFFLVA